jgi:hypothetical protein
VPKSARALRDDIAATAFFEIRRRCHDREDDRGEERIADEFLLKLGLRLSPATVRKYLSQDRPRGTTNDQRWATFVRNHARAIVACDFFVSVTVSFRVLYVFVAMEIGSRRFCTCNVTEHPSAEWTIQQFREFLAFDHPYRLLIHDRDAIFSSGLDTALQGPFISGRFMN